MLRRVCWSLRWAATVRRLWISALASWRRERSSVVEALVSWSAVGGWKTFSVEALLLGAGAVCMMVGGGDERREVGGVGVRATTVA
jgi:hypothetical protein